MMVHVDCLFQRMRYIFSLNGQLITQIEQMLESDEVKYVASTSLAFSELNYGMTTRVPWGSNSASVRTPVCFAKPRTICVLRSGSRTPRKMIVLTVKRSTGDFAKLLEKLTALFKLSTPVTSLYRIISGNQVVNDVIIIIHQKQNS